MFLHTFEVQVSLSAPNADISHGHSRSPEAKGSQGSVSYLGVTTGNSTVALLDFPRKIGGPVLRPLMYEGSFHCGSILSALDFWKLPNLSFRLTLSLGCSVDFHGVSPIVLM